MLLHSRSQRCVFAAQLQQALHVGVNVLLLRCATCLGKSVVRIAGESTRKVVPVVGVFAASHSDLITVIELGDSAQSCQQRKRQLQLLGRPVGVSQEALLIVVAD